MRPAGTPLEQVQAIAQHVETMAAHVREIDDVPRFTVMTLDLGVSDPVAVGDLFDIIAMGLRLIEADMIAGAA